MKKTIKTFEGFTWGRNNNNAIAKAIAEAKAKAKAEAKSKAEAEARAREYTFENMYKSDVKTKINNFLGIQPALFNDNNLPVDYSQATNLVAAKITSPNNPTQITQTPYLVQSKDSDTTSDSKADSGTKSATGSSKQEILSETGYPEASFTYVAIKN
jgi:hypothetical protein